MSIKTVLKAAKNEHIFGDIEKDDKWIAGRKCVILNVVIYRGDSDG